METNNFMEEVMSLYEIESNYFVESENEEKENPVIRMIKRIIEWFRQKIDYMKNKIHEAKNKVKTKDIDVENSTIKIDEDDEGTVKKIKEAIRNSLNDIKTYCDEFYKKNDIKFAKVYLGNNYPSISKIYNKLEKDINLYKSSVENSYNNFLQKSDSSITYGDLWSFLHNIMDENLSMQTNLNFCKTSLEKICNDQREKGKISVSEYNNTIVKHTNKLFRLAYYIGSNSSEMMNKIKDIL